MAEPLHRAWTSYHDAGECCDRPDCSECYARAERWIADHPAEAVAALIDTGALVPTGECESCGRTERNRYEAATDNQEGAP